MSITNISLYCFFGFGFLLHFSILFFKFFLALDLRLRRIFYPRYDPLHLFSYLNSWEGEIFPFLMFSAKQGNYWYHFITSLVWRGPWLGIEPGTSRTRFQHSTTRLSRRRYETEDWCFELSSCILSVVRCIR